MLTVAFLANEFPSSIEPYVIDEVEELQQRGVRVVTGSVRRPKKNAGIGLMPEIVLQTMPATTVIRAAWLCLRRWNRVAPLVWRMTFRGKEGPVRRCKAFAHTFLGACYAVLLAGRRVEHIHVHHGYFASWIALTAARLLGIRFSMTLYGSDLLLHGAYLDAKLEECAFCFTISEFNRRYLLEHYPNVEPGKVIMSRLGVDVLEATERPAVNLEQADDFLTLLAVGRLHVVKNHAFLVRACAQLQARNVPFQCYIVGEGPERRRLESQVRNCGLDGRITLLGYVSNEQRDSLYDQADVVVLTSHSEGIPVVLMEAMARGKIVLAPAITGIPELVIPGQTGFLYQPESLTDFLGRLLRIHALLQAERWNPLHRSTADGQLGKVRQAAQSHIRANFNRKTSVASFADLFLRRIVAAPEGTRDENLVLQQV